MDWKKTVTDLYEKINPLGGTLFHQISDSIINSNAIESVWIEFDLENFSYIDPFYGESESLGNFKMNIQFEWGNDVQFKTIQDIENREFHFDDNHRIGEFSNSLHFTVPFCKFGKIEKGMIPFEMKYSLTNSDSYGHMSGNIEEHLTMAGHIKTLLKAKNLLVYLPSDQYLNSVADFIDKDVYDVDQGQIATGLDFSFGHYKRIFEVPIK